MIKDNKISSLNITDSMRCINYADEINMLFEIDILRPRLIKSLYFALIAKKIIIFLKK